MYNVKRKNLNLVELYLSNIKTISSEFMSRGVVTTSYGKKHEIILQLIENPKFTSCFFNILCMLNSIEHDHSYEECLNYDSSSELDDVICDNKKISNEKPQIFSTTFNKSNESNLSIRSNKLKNHSSKFDIMSNCKNSNNVVDGIVNYKLKNLASDNKSKNYVNELENGGDDNSNDSDESVNFYSILFDKSNSNSDLLVSSNCDEQDCVNNTDKIDNNDNFNITKRTSMNSLSELCTSNNNYYNKPSVTLRNKLKNYESKSDKVYKGNIDKKNSSSKVQDFSILDGENEKHSGKCSHKSSKSGRKSIKIPDRFERSSEDEDQEKVETNMYIIKTPISNKMSPFVNETQTNQNRKNIPKKGNRCVNYKSLLDILDDEEVESEGEISSDNSQSNKKRYTDLNKRVPHNNKLHNFQGSKLSAHKFKNFDSVFSNKSVSSILVDTKNIVMKEEPSTNISKSKEDCGVFARSFKDERPATQIRSMEKHDTSSGKNSFTSQNVGKKVNPKPILTESLADSLYALL